MNKYQELFQNEDISVSESELINALDNISSWEDGYWLCKILMSRNSSVSDERLIETLEYCFFIGLSIANKEVFFDANECLAKLYIRYGMYNEASPKLQLLVYNYECPDWAHLYFATTQLYTEFERIVEEPKFFFDRLLKANFNDPEIRAEIRSVFGKYLCLISEKQTGAENIACNEIIQFAEKIHATATDEFQMFHEAVCSNLPYVKISDESDDIEGTREELERLKADAAKMKEEAARSQKAEETAKKAAKEAEEKAAQSQAEASMSREAADVAKRNAEKAKEEANRSKKAEEAAKQAAKAAQDKAAKSQEEASKSKDAADAARRDAEKAKSDAFQSRSAAEHAKNEAKKLEKEKSDLAARLVELEKTKQTALQPQNIDDVFFKINQWLNVPLRRYLAQWLTNNFSRTCKNDFWNKKVKPSLMQKELAKFDTYKELTDFAIDALLNIYYNNLNDFYSYNSFAKTNDRERIQEMQQIRNRWVGHFEENSWTKEKILFDIDTIIEFINQIEMPYGSQKEYTEFRALVAKMQ